MNLGPDQILNPGDPGDDMQRRLRYQAVRACIYILALFDDEEDIEEVFCEHHEDILLKYRSGTFLGIQIKTKLDCSVPVKAGDEEVLRSLKRFTETDKEFPGYFDGYLLASNSGFWGEVKNGSNLYHVLGEARGIDLKSAGKLVHTYLKKLCPMPKTIKSKAAPKKPSGAVKANKKVARISAEPPPAESYDAQLERTLVVLKKLRLEMTPPLANMEQPLLEALAKCPLVGQYHTYSDLKTIANTLIAEVLQASSKQHASCKVQYFAICRNPEQAQTESLIAAKRFARTRADEVIRRGIGRETRTATTTPFSMDQLPQGTRVQQAKMTAGGVVIDDVDEAVQQRQAAEYIVTTWLNKYGVQKANAKYQDVRSAVLTECNEAKNRAAQTGGQYGPAMLGLVKERVRALHASEGPRLHDLRYDQLLGIAGLLTEECRLWWSERFDLPEGVGS